jgi:hypothetical protein
MAPSGSLEKLQRHQKPAILTIAGFFYYMDFVFTETSQSQNNSV